MQKKSNNHSLPPFRKDIKLTRGPYDADGSPTYALYDPVMGNFYKINWKESLVFRHFKPGMDSEALTHNIEKHSTIKIDKEEIEAFFMQLGAAGLLAVHRDSSYYNTIKERRMQSWWMWLLYHYLYIRIPLINPDRFLNKSIKYVEFLGSRPAILCYACVSLFGFFLIFQRWDEFFHTFTYFFNLEGVIFYAFGITVTKLIHEFSHAFTAKHFKLYVPAMGIALIVLWPVLYTDVTEGWRLPNRKDRILISFAGVAAELVVAGFATIGWAFSTPGIFQSVCFVLATTSLAATLIINLNPAVRFDGYYIFCDLVGIDNLQNRAFNYARWRFHEQVLGVKMPPPETGVSTQRNYMFIVYTVYTYIYRIFLYTGIALFVYFKFTKALGILLFIAEVAIFMVWPVWFEIREVYKVRKLLVPNYRLIATLLTLTVLVAYLFLPWPHKMAYDAVIVPVDEQTLWVLQAGRIEKINVKRGQDIKKGQEIAVIQSYLINDEINKAKLEKEEAERRMLLLSLSAETVGYLAQMKDEQAIAQEKLEKLDVAKRQMRLQAEISGKLYEWDNDLKVHQNVPAGMVLGKIADLSKLALRCFVPESDIVYFKIGQRVTIYIENPLEFIEGIVTRIAPYSSENLMYPSLASINFGPLPVVEKTPASYP